jgi:lipoprotein-anchoring transpeptidase ErfK/SrfK
VKGKGIVLVVSVLACLAFAGAVQADDPPGTIPAGVAVGGVGVGGLTKQVATVTVQQAFDAPVELSFAGTRVLVTPDLLGAKAAVGSAVDQAATAAPNTQVALTIAVDQSVTAGFMARLAKRLDRAPVDSRLFLRNARPFLTQELPGLKLDQRRAVRDTVAALTANTRTPIALPGRRVNAKVTRAGFGAVIVIHRGENRLLLYDGMRYWRVFGVATGQTQYPTPLGRFTIVVKWRNPWWYPPASPWARGQSPIPPGPGNPLGTRWMGLSASGVGIHGTPSDGSIGYSVSHGCIRMHIPEAEWLFNHVDVGTTVFIVPN